MKKHIIIGLMAVALLFSSCAKDYLDTAPSNQVDAEVALSTLTGINLSMLGVYRAMTSDIIGSDQTGEWGWWTSSNTMPDNHSGIVCRYHSANGWYFGTYNFSSHATASNSTGWWNLTWVYNYNIIRRINQIIIASLALTPTEDEADSYNNVLGQAYALRALMNHTLLVAYSGHYESDTAAKSELGIPIRTTAVLESMARTNQYDSYLHVFSDIAESEKYYALMKSNDKHARAMNINATKMLKARVQLYLKHYDDALVTATDLIATSGKKLMGTEAYYGGFNDINNPEWIFGAEMKLDYSRGYRTFFSWWSNDFASTFIRQGPFCLDLSYLKGITDADIEREGANFEGGLVNTVGLTMREQDTRYGIFLTDTAEEIAANIKSNPRYYYENGTIGLSNMKVDPGMSIKYRTTGPEGLGDPVYMRLAEAYYIASEAAAYTGNDALAIQHLVTVTAPYDPTFTTTESGDDLKTLIANYKKVDMWGEGRGSEDIKRRATWVYRLALYHPILTYKTRQFKSVPPYSPDPLPIPDLTTYPIIQKTLDANPLLQQYVAK